MDLIVNSPKTLGQAIKRLRKSKKISQSAAGEPLRIHQTTMSNIEKGAEGTQIETLFRVLAALNLEMIIRSKSSDNSFKEEW